jgi:hypothetical protein
VAAAALQHWDFLRTFEVFMDGRVSQTGSVVPFWDAGLLNGQWVFGPDAFAYAREAFT